MGITKEDAAYAANEAVVRRNPGPLAVLLGAILDRLDVLDGPVADGAGEGAPAPVPAPAEAAAGDPAGSVPVSDPVTGSTGA